MKKTPGLDQSLCLALSTVVPVVNDQKGWTRLLQCLDYSDLV